MYEKVKRFYHLGLYTAEQVAQFVLRGKLTTDEYRKITGAEYCVLDTAQKDGFE